MTINHLFLELRILHSIPFLHCIIYITVSMFQFPFCQLNDSYSSVLSDLVFCFVHFSLALVSSRVSFSSTVGLSQFTSSTSHPGLSFESPPPETSTWLFCSSLSFSVPSLLAMPWLRWCLLTLVGPSGTSNILLYIKTYNNRLLTSLDFFLEILNKGEGALSPLHRKYYYFEGIN